MSLPRYPEYNDCGLAWISKIPSHWRVLPLLGIARERCESNTGMKEENLLSLSYGRIVRKDMASNEGLLPESFETYQIVRQGDVVFRLTDLQNDQRSLRTASVQEIGIITSAYLCVEPTRIDPGYFSYLLRAYDLSKVFYSMGGGLRQSMKYADVKRLPILIPSHAEQVQIVAFLDHETTMIDALIAEQEKLIALLAEKRQATISHAVTRGLNPNAPMKDSGSRWLGKLPAPWSVRSISSLSTKITNGYVGPTRDILVDEGVRYLQSLHIKNNAIRFESPYYVSEEWSEAHQKSILKERDVLIVQTGDIGQSAVVTADFEGCNCHALIIVSPVHRELDGRWLSWVLNSDYGVHSLLSIQTGALHPHLNCGNVKGLLVPLPSLLEQERIVEHIESVTSQFDTLVEDAERAIGLLKERRSALITAAVTGQIDVRGLAKEVAA